MANLYLTTENNEKAKLKSHDNVTWTNQLKIGPGYDCIRDTLYK